MKVRTIPQIRFVSGNTPEESVAEFNRVMVELMDLNPKFEREGHAFYIYYNVEQKEPETIVDEYKLKGHDDKCIDCPHCIRDLNRYGEIDARKKVALCRLTGERVRIDMGVCDSFYK